MLPIPKKEPTAEESSAPKKSKSKSKKDKDQKKKKLDHPGEEDIQFVSDLLTDLENLVCVDTSKIYATGMGTGGGMMHMLACDKELSTKFAAFAAVAGAFGRDKKGVWSKCEPGRPRIPIVEIHGMDDRIYPYYLKEGENGKVRTIPPHWIEDWAERNECGEPTRDPKPSADDEATFVTKLDNGWMTETIGYGGSATRIARKCFPKVSQQETKEEPKEDPNDVDSAEVEEEEDVEDETKRKPTGPIPDDETTVLHYQLKFFGHSWPRQQLMKQKQVVFKNKMIKPTKETYFDATKIILDFFKAHTLPEQFALRAEVTAEDPPTEEQTVENLDIKDGPMPEKESALEEKLRKFQETQEKIEELGTTDEKDEL
jgi:poly(3-hydroxybutyrate) depolymerase